MKAHPVPLLSALGWHLPERTPQDLQLRHWHPHRAVIAGQLAEGRAVNAGNWATRMDGDRIEGEFAKCVGFIFNSFTALV